MAVETIAPDAPPVEEQKTIETPSTFNPFDEKTWSEEAPVIVKAEEKPIVEEKKPEPVVEIKTDPVAEKVVEEKPKPEIKSSEEPFVLDPALKEKFLNDAYEVMAQKKEIEKAANLDVTKVADAKKILELNLKLKNGTLDPDELRDEIEERYSLPKEPKKPKVDADEDEIEVYNEKLDDWKEKVSKIEKKIIREAKLAKPELVKFNEGLKIPELPNVPQVATKNERSPEDMAEFNKMRGEYLTSIDSGVKDFKGFTFTGTNKDVPVSVTYNAEESEKTTLRTRFEDFDSNAFLQSRWLTKDGKFNGKQQTEDVYRLENFEKIVQKAVDEAVKQSQLHFEKVQKNVDVTGNVPRGTFQPETKGNYQEVMDTIWST